MRNVSFSVKVRICTSISKVIFKKIDKVASPDLEEIFFNDLIRFLL